MKRKIAFILMLVMLMLLTACQQAPKGATWQHITKDGEVVGLTINFDEQTITASDDIVTVIAYDSNGNAIGDTPTEDKDVYHYTYDDGNITITYPNGATYWESSTAGGWDNDYDPERYIEGDVLAQQLNQAYQYARKNWDSVFLVGLVCLLIIGLCIVDIIHPDIFYRLRYGLWVQNAEPTEFAMTMSRIGGIVGIVLSVILFLLVLFE